MFLQKKKKKSKNRLNSPSGFRSDNFVASINNLVEAGSPEMVSVTELGNGMMRPSTHLLNARTTVCTGCSFVVVVVISIVSPTK